jgi:DnaK suppressor protein
VRIDPRSGLTETQVEFLRGELLEEQQHLLEAQQQLLEQRRALELGRESEPRGDAADQAELSLQQALLAERIEAHRRRVREIEEALARIEEGRYGLDVTTGAPIGFERLTVEPWARHTEGAQESAERGSAPGRP